MKALNPLLHNELRLAIMSLLISLEEAEFAYLKKETNASAGNLSVQLSKLQEAGYITIEKSFRNNYPLTNCKVTKEGIEKFEEYTHNIMEYLKVKK
jgi:DNA-binding transcriptional ArsR family regulator